MGELFVKTPIEHGKADAEGKIHWRGKIVRDARRRWL